MSTTSGTNMFVHTEPLIYAVRCVPLAVAAADFSPTHQKHNPKVDGARDTERLWLARLQLIYPIVALKWLQNSASRLISLASPQKSTQTLLFGAGRMRLRAHLLPRVCVSVGARARVCVCVLTQHPKANADLIWP